MGDNRYREPAIPPSPILSIERADTADLGLRPRHRHPEPVLLWSATATVKGTAGSREWLVPPGYGLWIPGHVDHDGSVLRTGEVSVLHFDAERCPIRWTEPTGVAVGPLPQELIRHLQHCAPDDPGRPLSEALLFQLLTPLATHDIQIEMPAYPRIRTIAERLEADPSDQRELTDWADHVHTSVRTLSRVFRAETGLTFAAWRTRLRIRAAIRALAAGSSVNATSRAVGYRSPSAFITAFRRATGHTPGTYLLPTTPERRRPPT